MPACLPITTDFLPDKRTLQQDYVTYAYDLIPEDQFNDTWQLKYLSSEEDSKKNSTTSLVLTTDRVYMELICQRLQQGFQLILQPKSEMSNCFDHKGFDKSKYILSIGRIYHELLLKESKITITYYHPRHPYNAKNIQYCYRIRTPDNETYGVSWVEFAGEKLETYKWNYLDNYICSRGDSDYQLIEGLKFWRFRLLVLPTMHSITKKIIDQYMSDEETFQCDLYHVFTVNEKLQLQTGFLKFIEMINRIKRPVVKLNNRTEPNRNTQLTNRRNSSTISADTAPSIYSNRHSQPADTMTNNLAITGDTQTRFEQILLKSDHQNSNAGFGAGNKLNDQTNIETSRLSINSCHNEIVKAMMSSKYLFYSDSFVRFK